MNHGVMVKCAYRTLECSRPLILRNVVAACANSTANYSSFNRKKGRWGYSLDGQSVVVLACSVGSLCVMVSMLIFLRVGRRGW